jgi:Domain of unknown function (DUF4942)
MTGLFAGSLVKSVSIDNMLNQRDAALSKINQALDLLTEGQALARSAGVGFPRFKLDESRYSVYNLLDLDSRADATAKIRRVVDAGGWQYLMSESGLRSLMDAKARETWDKDIDEGKFPEFTRDNLTSTFSRLHDSRGEMFDRGVIAVFKSLSWDYKTNRPFAFGKRIVITYMRSSVSGGTGSSLGHVNHSSTDQLDDLVRVLSILDGKPEPDHRNGMWSALNTVRCVADGDVDTEYLTIRCYRNGNGHILFKRPDLVTKMNAILAKHYPGALAHDHSVVA